MNSTEIIARVRGGVFTHSGPKADLEHIPRSTPLIASAMLFVSHPPSFETLIPYSVVLSLSLPRARDLLQQKGERFIFTRENKSIPIFCHFLVPIFFCKRGWFFHRDQKLDRRRSRKSATAKIRRVDIRNGRCSCQISSCR